MWANNLMSILHELMPILGKCDYKEGKRPRQALEAYTMEQKF